MSYFAGLLSGLDERRRETRATEMARQEKLGDLEFAMLTQLAQGDDPELASLAGAGILETLAGNRKVTGAKGLRGFLGEMDRSSFLPSIRQVLQQRGQQPPTPAMPGGAALPAGSPVEPPRQPPYEMPITARQGLGVAPGQVQTGAPPPPAGGGTGLGTGMVPDGSSAPLPATGFPATPFAGTPPPPPPEPPAQKFARLYPSAAETQARSRAAAVVAEYDAIFQALEAAKGDPVKTGLVLSKSGQPVAQFRPQAVMATYIDQDGQERTEAGELQSGGRVFVGGREVRATDVRLLSQRQGRLITGKPEIDENGDTVYPMIHPETGEVVSYQRTNVPPTTPSPYYGAPVYTEGGGMGVINRPTLPGEPPQVTRIPGAVAPPRGSTSQTNTSAVREAKLFIAQVKEIAKTRAAQKKDLVTGTIPRLSDQEMDTITKEATEGAFTSWKNLQRAGAALGPTAEPPPTLAGTFGSPEGAAKIRQMLDARARKPR